MVPVAPGLFSTTIGWPSLLDKVSPRMRDTVSTGPPAGKPTTSLIGRFGHGGWAKSGAEIRAESPPSAVRRVIVIMIRPPTEG